MKILIIKLGAIGDVIRTTSILPGLREKYKDCKIDWLTKKEPYDILKNNTLIDKIYVIDELKNKLKEKHIVIYTGKGPLTDVVFQVGNIGNFGKNQIDYFLQILQEILKPEAKKARFYGISQMHVQNS